MFAMVYRWRVSPGKEQLLIDGWHRVTMANIAPPLSPRRRRPHRPRGH